MKSGSLAFLALVVGLNIAPAQQPAAAPKPPVGVPADAKPFDGKWYRVYLERLPWGSAKQKCTSLGGRLAVIPDEETWAFVKELAGDASLWLGATDEKTPNVWEWVDGTRVTFTAWLPGQPDHAWGGREHYLHTRYRGWNDAQQSGVIDDRNRVVGYICEWKKK